MSLKFPYVLAVIQILHQILNFGGSAILVEFWMVSECIREWQANKPLRKASKTYQYVYYLLFTYWINILKIVVTMQYVNTLLICLHYPS